jgi:Uma2 family endonuclease
MVRDICDSHHIDTLTPAPFSPTLSAGSTTEVHCRYSQGNPMSLLMEVWPQRHRITVDEYHRMAEVGLLAPDARVELIEGEIIDMAPIGPPHSSVVNQLTRWLVRAVGDLAIVQAQGAVRLNLRNEPEPDLALFKPRDDFYRHRHASGTDTLLVIEVSESSLRYDREIKVPLYARPDVPEVWVVDLVNGQILAWHSPVAGEYQHQSSISQLGVVTLAALPGVTVDLSGLGISARD